MRMVGECLGGVCREGCRGRVGGGCTGLGHRGEACSQHREGLVDVRGKGSEELLVVKAWRGVLRGDLGCGCGAGQT